MGQIKFIVSLMIFGLFTISILTFAILFGLDNEAGINIGDDATFSNMQIEMKSNVTQFYTDVETGSDAMYQSTISSQTDSTEGGTAFKVTPSSALFLATSGFKSAFTQIFGSDSNFGIFITALISILGLVSFLYIWKTWKGQPD